MTGVRATSPTCLYLCPDAVSVKDETPMMLYLKDEESRGADEDARDSAGDQKGGSETDRAEADRKILPGVSL